MNQHSGFDSVRRQYGVPAYYGARVVYRAYRGRPISGTLISCTGSHLYMRREDGTRFGPLHPTSKMDYGDGRDYGAECNKIIDLYNDWLNERIDTTQYRVRVAAVRKAAVVAAQEANRAAA